MTQTTGGHYLDTGSGPTPIGVLSGNALESKAQTAYRAYLDHRPTCSQCQHHPIVCSDAKDLWAAYAAARDDS